MTASTIPMKWSKNQTVDNRLRCVCCNRVIEDESKAKWVEVINGGSDVAAPGLGPDQSDSGYMGFYPIGLTCARNHFQGFVHQ